MYLQKKLEKMVAAQKNKRKSGVHWFFFYGILKKWDAVSFFFVFLSLYPQNFLSELFKTLRKK